LNPEVFTTGTPEKQTDDTPKFRTTPFGTPNRTTSRLGQNIKRDTEKDIRDLLACIVDEDGKELSVEKIEEPAGLAVTLLDHQKLGVAWMKRQEQSQYKGGILADDVSMVCDFIESLNSNRRISVIDGLGQNSTIDRTDTCSSSIGS
jgi:SNF2 family DNA or RNA helicase